MKAANQTIRALIERIRNPDEAVSGAAWQNAAPYGASAVKSLAQLMDDPDSELARKAKRALYRVVRRGGYLWRSHERRAIESELIQVLRMGSSSVRREVVWMLSEIGSRRAVSPIAGLLTDHAVREDARCALTRHPSSKATVALRAAFAKAPEDFKYALAESLRQRGESVEGFASRKLVPTAQTEVKPIQPRAG